MTLRKITTDNSARYIPKREQTSEIKQNTIKNKSTPRKENKKLSQNIKKFPINVIAQGFVILK